MSYYSIVTDVSSVIYNIRHFGRKCGHSHVGLCLQIKTERRGTDVENDDDYFGRSGFFTHYSVLTTLTDSQAQVT